MKTMEGKGTNGMRDEAKEVRGERKGETGRGGKPKKALIITPPSS